MFKSTWKCHAVFIINHGGSHWCKELPLKELLLPRTCAFMNIASSQRRENTTGLQYAGHWTSRKTLRNHSRLYLSLLWVFSKPENQPGCISCSCVHPVMSSPWKQCHLVVGHTLNTLKYIVSKNEVNRTDGSRDIDIFVSPLSLKFLLFWPLPANTPETRLQIQHLNNLSPSLPRPLQMPLPVHWQWGQHPSACLSMTGTPKTHTIPSPYFAVPWRTGSSSTAFCQTVRTTSGMFLQS